MTPDTAPDSRWPLRRWIVLFSSIALAHLAFIFLFGEKNPPSAKSKRPASTLKIGSSLGEELASLQDPTLFALPHEHTFSGLNRLPREPLQTNRFAWPDEPFVLLLAPQSLAAPAVAQPSLEFSRVSAATEPLPAFPKPALQAPPALPTQSWVRIEGPLKSRLLLQPLQLPARMMNDLLTNTVVSLAVDNSGDPVTVSLLSASGVPEADQLALKTANQAQFEPNTPPGPGNTRLPIATLTWGRMVFDWNTLPPTATNAPGTNPAPKAAGGNTKG